MDTTAEDATAELFNLGWTLRRSHQILTLPWTLRRVGVGVRVLRVRVRVRLRLRLRIRVWVRLQEATLSYRVYQHEYYFPSLLMVKICANLNTSL